ncbi:hypothetical protein V8C44DRAFT_1817 [Trichoderma aethiopicum]
MALLARMLCDPLWLACGGRKGKEEREKEGKSWEKRRDPLFVPLADAFPASKKIHNDFKVQRQSGRRQKQVFGVLVLVLVWRPSLAGFQLSQPRRPPAKTGGSGYTVLWVPVSTPPDWRVADTCTSLYILYLLGGWCVWMMDDAGRHHQTGPIAAPAR